ncbi:MAG: hypothetical protein A2176_16045 [Spirochaetes bacterium RBG_13_51_14]|nr:MAG: hypothetical protein A2176_16045 [Spirochaetes bacterium RBG_13_51_14]
MSDLKILKGRYGNILRSVMNTVIPRGGAYAPGAADYDLLPRAEEMLMSYDPSIRGLFPLMLNYIQFSALIHQGKIFTSLSEEKGAQFLSSMEASPFFYRRLIMLMMKLITMLAFYGSDETERLVGYKHGCHLK